MKNVIAPMFKVLYPALGQDCTVSTAHLSFKRKHPFPESQKSIADRVCKAFVKNCPGATYGNPLGRAMLLDTLQRLLKDCGLQERHRISSYADVTYDPSRLCPKVVAGVRSLDVNAESKDL